MIFLIDTIILCSTEDCNPVCYSSLTFSKSIRGAEASATIYSITETAILNGLKPYNYLTYVLENMKNLGPFPEKEELLKLLPWSPSLPDDCRSRIKK